MDQIMSGLADILNKIAEHVPAIPLLPLAEMTAALADFIEAVQLWQEVFPWLFDVMIAIGIMIAIKLAMIAWYWINWLIKKIPFIG